MKFPCFLWSTTILGVLLSSGTNGSSLLSTRPQSRSSPACCQGDSVKSCLQMKLHPSALGKDELYLDPLNATLKFVGRIGESMHSFQYTNKDVDFTVTMNRETKHAYGHVALGDGRIYVLEYCGKKMHVLKEYDMKEMNNQSKDEVTGNFSKKISHSKSSHDTRSSKIETYTVKVYYTREFKQQTSDIHGFVENMINEANDAFIKSGVSLRVRVHTLEMASIAEIKDDDNAMLDNFNAMKTDVRGTADTATLLVSDNVNYAGIAGLDTIASKDTTSICVKSFVQTMYTFSHEQGHNIGLKHNVEAYTNPTKTPPFPDGWGFRLARSGLAWTGSASIMAYWDDDYKRINRYSDPNYAPHPLSSNKLGKEHFANSVRVLNLQKSKLAAVGDESSCVIDNHWTGSQLRWKSVEDPITCKRKCNKDKTCLTWYTETFVSWWGRITYDCYHILAKRYLNNGYATGPHRECIVNEDIRKDSECLFNHRKSAIRYNASVWKASPTECNKACDESEVCTYWWYRKRDKRCFFRDVKYDWDWWFHSGSGYFC